MREGQKPYYLFIHGAWHAKNCWDDVVFSLRALGEKAEAMDLPGHGKNLSEYSTVSLETYVQSVIQKIESLGQSVILVGHSMAGIVISQVGENIPECIQKLIYIAAYVPTHRGSLMLEARRSKETGISSAMLINEDQYSIRLKETADLKSLFFNQCPPELIDKALSSLQETPLRPFRDRLTLSADRFGKLEKIYIQCVSDKLLCLSDQHRLSEQAGCLALRLDSDHSPFYSATAELVQLLKSLG